MGVNGKLSQRLLLIIAARLGGVEANVVHDPFQNLTVAAPVFLVCARDYYGEFNVEKVKIASVYLIDMGHMDVF